jgi:subtilisin family serine protease
LNARVVADDSRRQQEHVQHSCASEWSPISSWRRTLSLLVLLSLVAAAASLSVAAPARADGGTPPVLTSVAAATAPTQLIVTFKSAVAKTAAVSDTISQAGATPVGTLALGGASIVSVPTSDSAAAISTLKADPNVAAVRVDPVVHATLNPNDPSYAGTYSPCAGSLGCWPFQELQLPAAWDTTTGSASVTVAVVDTGVDATHEDLAGAVLPGFNEITQTSNAADDYGHGTEVAGTIAARGNNGLGSAGACWSCKILPVKVLDQYGSGSTSNVANGIVWAVDHGANIINLSLAGGSNDPSYVTALNYAVAHGVLVVIAAGNAGSDNPATYPGGYPAYDAQAIPGVISVGAMDYFSTLYSFSNYGSWVEVAAPGCAQSTTMDGGYTTGVCGTSIASPWVAGAAALALSYDPSLTPAELETAIESTASLTLPSTRMLSSGSGVSCGGLCTGYGAVNVKALLQSLGASYNPPTLVAPPAVAGTAQVGSILSGTDGSFSGSGGTITLSHDWLRCDAGGNNCSAISGATASSYTLVQADGGSTLRFQTTATDSNGSSSDNSDATAVVIAAVPGNTALPTISGSTAVGDTLSASTGGWSNSPTSYGYEWLRDGSAISGATGSSYAIVDADVGHALSVRVTATNADGQTAATSLAAGPVADSTPTPVVTPPVVTPPSGGGGGGGGTRNPPDLTLTLAASSNQTGVGGQVQYRISVYSKSTGGATGMHLLVSLPVGATLAGSSVTRGSGCVQTGQTVDCNLDFLSPPQTADVVLTINFASAGSFTLPFTATTRDLDPDPSNNSANATVTVGEPPVIAQPPVVKPPEAKQPAAPQPTAAPVMLIRPSVNGTARVGQRLTALPGRWKGVGITYTYRWSRRNADGSHCIKLAATGRRYLLTGADQARRISVTVTAHNRNRTHSTSSRLSKPVAAKRP